MKISRFYNTEYVPVQAISGKVLDDIRSVDIPENILKKIFSCLDLTSLNAEDTTGKIFKLCTALNAFHNVYPHMPDVAAVCVYPCFISMIRENLKNTNIDIVSVAAGFPSAQTFIEIKVKEIEMAVASGATEIDIVMPLGRFLSEQYDSVFDEIRLIKQDLEHTRLKVILETGLLKEPGLIWKASLMAMEAGADFIKTSTGKVQPAATYEAFHVMAQAVKAYHEHADRQVGLKPAGGISTTQEALKYYYITEQVLGPSWLTRDLFRIGASRLANALLHDIYGSGRMHTDYF